MLSPYSGQVAKEITKIFPYPHKRNMFYGGRDGRWLYENQKGFIHMLKVCRIENIGYTFNEYMLNKQGQFVDTGKHFSLFNNRQDAIDQIEKGDGYGGELQELY